MGHPEMGGWWVETGNGKCDSRFLRDDNKKATTTARAKVNDKSRSSACGEG
jgi:hypothetical protein